MRLRPAQPIDSFLSLTTMKTTNAHTSAWVHNRTQLATILGVTRQTVGNWQRAPGAPKPLSNGKLSVARWIAFAREHSRDGAGTSEERQEKHELEKRRLRVQCDKLEFGLQVAQGEFISNERIHDTAIRAGAVLNAGFQRLEMDFAGSCVGLSRDLIQVKVREKLADLHRAFQGELDSLQPLP